MSDAARRILVVASDGAITGYDRATGAKVWEHEEGGFEVLGLKARYASMADIAIHEGRVFALMRDALVCLDYATGALIGKVQMTSKARRPTFVIDEGRIYVVSGNSVECYEMNGARAWSTPRSQTIVSGAALGFPGNVKQGDLIGS